MENVGKNGPKRAGDKAPKEIVEVADVPKAGKGTLKAGFVLSIIAAVLCMAPPVGLILAVIAFGLMLPEIIKVVKEKKLPAEGQGKFIVGTILSIVALLGGLVAVINAVAPKEKDKRPEIEQMYSTLEKLDLNGETVSDACTKLRAAGWKVSQVTSGKYGSDRVESDCSDTEHKVSSVNYGDKKYSEYSGDELSSYETASIEFVDNAKVESSSSDEAKEETPSSSNNSSSSNNESNPSSSNSSSSSSGSAPSSSSSSNSNSTNASFRKVMDDYESFMDKYVDFMKRYKNSSDVTSMLSEYSSIMQDYAKFADSIKGYNQDNLSTSDWAYYLEVTSRVTSKLAEVL